MVGQGPRVGQGMVYQMETRSIEKGAQLIVTILLSIRRAFDINLMSFEVNLFDFAPVSLANCRNYLQYLIVSQFHHDTSIVIVLVWACYIKVDTIAVPVKTCRIARETCTLKFVLLFRSFR